MYLIKVLMVHWIVHVIVIGISCDFEYYLRKDGIVMNDIYFGAHYAGVQTQHVGDFPFNQRFP